MKNFDLSIYARYKYCIFGNVDDVESFNWDVSCRMRSVSQKYQICIRKYLIFKVKNPETSVSKLALTSRGVPTSQKHHTSEALQDVLYPEDSLPQQSFLTNQRLTSNKKIL